MTLSDELDLAEGTFFPPKILNRIHNLKYNQSAVIMGTKQHSALYMPVYNVSN